MVVLPTGRSVLPGESRPAHQPRQRCQLHSVVGGAMLINQVKICNLILTLFHVRNYLGENIIVLIRRCHGMHIFA